MPSITVATTMRYLLGNVSETKMQVTILTKHIICISRAEYLM